MTRLARSRYETFVEGRTTYVRLTLQTTTDGGATWSAIDVSASSLSVHLRAWKRPPVDGSSSYIVDVTLTKITAASGIVGGYVEFAAEYGQVECEVVLIDTGAASSVTTSGYREQVIHRWLAEVVSAVRASS